MTKVAIFGAAGRMGGVLIRCGTKSDGIRVVAALESAGHEAVGADAGALADLGEIGVLVTDKHDVVAEADVGIDFTFHTAVPENAQRCAGLGKPLVIGTTGLDDGEAARVREAARRVPVVWAPNMSLGMNLLFATVERAAGALGMGYKIEINETHHVHKKDAPSGTALRLGEKAARGRNQDFHASMIHEPGETGHSHPADRIVIHSHREGEVVGMHTVSFANEGERIEFGHDARSRDAFAMGALRAAGWVVGREPGLYDMQDVLGL